MDISSSAFENNQVIPVKYTCDGENINPPLTFRNVPTEAKSLVLVVDDPDAPSGAWTHWLVYNLDPTIIEIKENSVPNGALQGMTSFGRSGYGGPCPPSGTHHYYFKLYALDTQIENTSDIDQKNFLTKIENHILDQAELIGLYSRNN